METTPLANQEITVKVEEGIIKLDLSGTGVFSRDEAIGILKAAIEILETPRY